MTATTAEIEVVMPGMLEALSVGKGDIKITVGGDDPEDVAKGRAVIEEMLAKGYGIFVPDKNGRLRRVRKFNPKRMEYVVSEVGPAGKAVDQAVPVAGSKATAIGRTSGG